MDKTTDAKIPNGWRLRPATCDIVTGLHALVSMPMVYRYLFDGEAPDKELIANRIGGVQTGNWSWYVGVKTSLRAIRWRSVG